MPLSWYAWSQQITHCSCSQPCLLKINLSFAALRCFLLHISITVGHTNLAEQTDRICHILRQLLTRVTRTMQVRKIATRVNTVNGRLYSADPTIFSWWVQFLVRRLYLCHDVYRRMQRYDLVEISRLEPRDHHDGNLVIVWWCWSHQMGLLLPVARP